MSGGELRRAATPCWGRLADSSVAERRVVKDADIITARYTEGGHALANATARQPEIAGIGRHVRMTAPASGGCRRSSMAAELNSCAADAINAPINHR